MSVKKARYRHYKGQEYVFLGVTRQSETGEELVVCRQDCEEKSSWVRPLAMFEENVEVAGRQLPRLESISER